jgi:hypothetical protein
LTKEEHFLYYCKNVPIVPFFLLAPFYTLEMKPLRAWEAGRHSLASDGVQERDMVMLHSLTFRLPKTSNPMRVPYGVFITALLSIVVSMGLVLFNFLPARGVTPVLPGQQIWKDGVSSYLFGTNEVAWEPMALSNPAILATVKAAGVPLIRVPLTAQNADQRVKLVEQAGAQCLGIVSWHNPADALKVVQMLGKRCLLYEFGNEPDPLSSYITAWNSNIAALRQANPAAKFIGPVLASPDANGIKQFLSAVKSNPPDVVSWHMYPCTNRTLQVCESGSHINFSKHAQEIGAVIQSTLGHDVPQAITEYNYDWQDGKTPNHDASTMQQFTTQALNDMIQAEKYGVIMANEYQLGGRAGAGTLDMVDPGSGAPLAQFSTMSQFIASYRAATNSPTGTASPGGATATPVQPCTSNPANGSTSSGVQYPITIGSQSFCCTIPPWLVANTGQGADMPTDTTKRTIQCVLVAPSNQQTTGVTPTTGATGTATPEETPTITSTSTTTATPKVTPTTPLAPGEMPTTTPILEDETPTVTATPGKTPTATSGETPTATPTKAPVSANKAVVIVTPTISTGANAPIVPLLTPTPASKSGG